MKTISINKYRANIRKYIDETDSDDDMDIEKNLTVDDVILLKKIQGLYSFRRMDKLLEIIKYLRDKSACNESLELANELEALLNAEEATTADAPCQVAPVEPDEAMNLDIFPTTNIVTPDKISATDSNPKTPRYVHQPVYPKIKPENPVNANDGAGELKPQNQSSPVPSPVHDIYYIKPTDIVKIHELAAIFPMMAVEEFKDFKQSIKSGQKLPVVMYNDVLIDGRQRLKACQELGINIMAVKWPGTGSVEEFIYASNLARRHLNAGQRAAFAVKLLPNIEAEAAQRKNSGKASNLVEKIPQGRSAYIAGEKLGVNGKYVIDAKKVAEASEELFAKVLTGELSLSYAKREIKTTQAIPDQPERKLFTVAESVTKLVKLITADNNERLRGIAENSQHQVSKAIIAWLNKELTASTEDNTRDELNQDSA